MAKQPLTKPDLTHGAPAGEGEQPNMRAPESASPLLFDPSGTVEPSEPTANAIMPDAPIAEKRGRGRPKGAGASQKKSTKKITPEQAELQGMASAHLIVGAMDMLCTAIAGEPCPDGTVTREMTIDAWRQYLEQNGWEVPAWVQVAVISSSYMSKAFHTERGRGVLSGAWAKTKAAYIEWRG